MPEIPARERQRQNFDFKVSLIHIASSKTTIATQRPSLKEKSDSEREESEEGGREGRRGTTFKLICGRYFEEAQQVVA